MDQIKMKHSRSVIAIAAIALLPATIFGQTALPASHTKTIHARTNPQVAQHEAKSADASAATTYDYTLVSYPGTLNTLGVGINPSAIRGAGLDVVGAEFFPDDLSQTGFLANISESENGVTERYQLLNDPQAPTPQQSYSINDYGVVVGDYIDAAGIFHSYVYDCGQFKKFDVPFAGATGTYSPAINNAGEIVGSWNDSAGNAHSYTLINGKFVSFDVPGSAQSQLYYGINSQGEITGSYADASGVIHGFLKKGNTYTTIDFPGGTYTVPSGINDAGVIVGGYCLTSDCANTGDGEMGFLLSKGVFTSVNVPSEPIQAVASINDDGVIMGNYIDAAGYVYTYVGVPQP